LSKIAQLKEFDDHLPDKNVWANQPLQWALS
jgi:hypothetical protein